MAGRSYVELAVQNTSNPPAKYLHGPTSKLISSHLHIRVGGSFTYPPFPPREFKRVVFVAGGVGANPLMSMLSHIKSLKDDKQGNQYGRDVEIRFLYATKAQSFWREILFFERIRTTMADLGMSENFKLFLTPQKPAVATGTDETSGSDDPEGVQVSRRRVTHDDLLQALGPASERNEVLCYVCGVPGMTDEYVKAAREAEGMVKENVLCETWW